MVNGNDLIRCDNSDGARAYFVARDKIFPRPSVYGLISHAARLLLIRLPNGKYVLPGGGVNRGERLEEALRREILEETGITIAINGLYLVNESLIYFPDEDRAAHLYRFVYRCTPQSVELTNVFNIPEAIDHETPCWAPIAQLCPSHFHTHAHAEIAFDYLRHQQLTK